jgi:hypothetical protein
MTQPSDLLPFRVRRSRIHGTGVFATRAIKKGARLIEYVGERVSHAEADRRYAHKADNDNHTFLFTVDARTVIDAGVGGNAARFINHSCDPNCETVIENRRIFIEATRDIAPGEELGYDYMIERDAGDPANIDDVFRCRCGSVACRGSMLLPPQRPRLPRAPARAARSKRRAEARPHGAAPASRRRG